jgi:hypothetical protein
VERRRTDAQGILREDKEAIAKGATAGKTDFFGGTPLNRQLSTENLSLAREIISGIREASPDLRHLRRGACEVQHALGRTDHQDAGAVRRVLPRRARAGRDLAFDQRFRRSDPGSRTKPAPIFPRNVRFSGDVGPPSALSTDRVEGPGRVFLREPRKILEVRITGIHYSPHDGPCELLKRVPKADFRLDTM